MTFRNWMLTWTATLAFASGAFAQAPQMLQAEDPVVVRVIKPQPYEVGMGTIIQVVLDTRDPGPDGLVVGMVSTNIYDYYGNIAIPAGSRVVGKLIRQINDRHEVVWDGLQIPAFAGTLRLAPPIEATMPDGSTGVVKLAPGMETGAIVGNAFIVPH